MKEVLDKVRLEYRDDYEKFINKMERETDEVGVVVVGCGSGGIGEGGGGRDG